MEGETVVGAVAIEQMGRSRQLHETGSISLECDAQMSVALSILCLIFFSNFF